MSASGGEGSVELRERHPIQNNESKPKGQMRTLLRRILRKCKLCITNRHFSSGALGGYQYLGDSLGQLT